MSLEEYINNKLKCRKFVEIWEHIRDELFTRQKQAFARNGVRELAAEYATIIRVMTGITLHKAAEDEGTELSETIDYFFHVAKMEAAYEAIKKLEGKPAIPPLDKYETEEKTIARSRARAIPYVHMQRAE